MRQCGVITQIKDTRATVLMQRHSMCSSCNACSMGHSNRKIEIEAINDIDAQVGQWVEIDMDKQNFLMATFIAYGIPFLTLILGIFMGTLILSNLQPNKNTEIYAALLGFVFMFTSYFIIRKNEKSFKTNRRFIPSIVGIVNNDDRI